MLKATKKVAMMTAAALLAGCAGTMDSMMGSDQQQAMDKAADEGPFGGPSDVQYAKVLWQAMKAKGYVGSDALMSTPYPGQHPHGAVLDTFDTEVTLGNNTGELIVKRNYGGEGVSKTTVANDPDAYLKAVTVMYKRDGYDPENEDWFWVKYNADGSLATNPKGMKLAGKVAKGTNAGCIACHKAAPGGDMVFNHDRYATE